MLSVLTYTCPSFPLPATSIVTPGGSLVGGASSLSRISSSQKSRQLVRICLGLAWSATWISSSQISRQPFVGTGSAFASMVASAFVPSRGSSSVPVIVCSGGTGSSRGSLCCFAGFTSTVASVWGPSLSANN